MGKKHHRPVALSVARTEDVPLKEVSGICLRRGPGGVLQVVAIGDRAAVGAWTVVPDEPGAPLHWEVAPLTGLAGTRIPENDAQIEAVCADGAGRVLLLQESPPRVELVDPQARRVIASIDLRIPDGHALSASWGEADGSRGEGAIFLANGHLLVAKEKDPPALIEFGPAGEAAAGFRAGSDRRRSRRLRRRRPRRSSPAEPLSTTAQRGPSNRASRRSPCSRPGTRTAAWPRRVVTSATSRWGRTADSTS